MVKPTTMLAIETQMAAITRGGIRFLCFLCDHNYGRARHVMHQYTYVSAEVRTLAREVGGLHYTNLKVGHCSLRIATYICDGACSVVLRENSAEYVNCALAELLPLVLILVLGIAELDTGSCSAPGGHVVAEPETNVPSLNANQPRSRHLNIMTHHICT
jgi:hypothetical protein